MNNDVRRLARLAESDDYLPDVGADLGNWDEHTRAWRIERFRRMGFGAYTAEKLAAARCWTGDVEDALAAGCSHAAATRIYL